MDNVERLIRNMFHIEPTQLELPFDPPFAPDAFMEMWRLRVSDSVPPNEVWLVNPQNFRVEGKITNVGEE